MLDGVHRNISDASNAFDRMWCDSLISSSAMLMNMQSGSKAILNGIFFRSIHAVPVYPAQDHGRTGSTTDLCTSHDGAF